MPETSSNRPDGLFVPPGAGAAISFIGVTVTVKVRASATGGLVSAIEYLAPPRFAGPPPHFHKAMTETFYVLNGTLRFSLAGRQVEAEPGAVIVAPPRVVHAFSNPGDQPARFLSTFNPGGMEGYFEELLELVRQEGKWPLADMSKVVELARRYDTYPPGELYCYRSRT